ncbi:MAG: CvpA family protein [Sphingobacteriia bacterium]|nr:MAG: CvpA family protein [Sphingobacteriia bacterium]
MLIDGITALFVFWALFKGWRNGLVVALFSFAAFYIGLAAALKCSTLVARWLETTAHLKGAWLPFLAFVLVLLAVALGIRAVAKILQTLLELGMMGWANRLGGVLLYAGLYLILWSVLIFYAEKMQILSPETVSSSRTYPWLHAWGPACMDLLGKAIPLFKGMFAELSSFFDQLSRNLA